MKKELIIGSFLAFYATINAQGWDQGSSVYSTPIQIEVGTGVSNVLPYSQLDVNTTDPLPYSAGESIFQRGSNGSAALHLNTYHPGGYAWGLYSLGNNNHVGAANMGDFCIYEEVTGFPTLTIKNRSGMVGIGNSNPTLAKLQVESNSGSAGWFQSSGYSGGMTIGLVGQANGWSNSTSLANIGVDATSDTQAQGIGTSIAVYGAAYSGHLCWGGRFEGQANSGNAQNIGVYAATNGVGNCWAAYFNGDMNVSGKAFCTASAWSSDRKLKKDIKPLNNTLEKIRQLNPSTYLFKTDEFKGMNLPEEKQMGLIAQELEEVFPELVYTVKAMTQTDKMGNITYTIPEHKAINYIGLVPLLISGIQEQQTTIEAQQKTIAQQSQINSDLQKQLDEQKQQMNDLAQKVSGATGFNSVNGVETGFTMSQNEPNPFTHETVVKYTLPQTTGNAFMAVYDLTGKQITTFAIDQKGSASITITSEKLAAGIYIYSIVADGKVMDSKRMIVADK